MKNLKVFINQQPAYSPYGGSVHFVANLHKFLEEKGCKVIYNLERGIDLIIIVSNSLHKYKQKIGIVLKYIKKHSETRVIQRINNCNLRKNMNNIDKLVLKTNKFADETIFVSNWLAKYFKKKEFNKSYHVIHNGCNQNFFYPNKSKEIGRSLLLITHHWSNHWMKGFDIYNKLDKNLPTHKDLSFTYIGNYYKGYTPKNTKINSPLYGKELGDELRKADIYLTASRWEPGANHIVEGASCGLPVLFHRDGGGINEVCKNYGLEYYDIPTLLKSIEEIRESYQDFRNRIPYELLSSEKCCESYYKIIFEMFN